MAEDKKNLHQSITITLDDGTERDMEILLTYTNKDTNLSYVLYYDYISNDDKVYAFRYDDDGNLYQLETDEEWEMVENVFNAYMAEDEIDEENNEDENEEEKDEEEE